MTRNFGIVSRSTRGSHAHIDYRAPHAQSPGNDCNPKSIRLVASGPSLPGDQMWPTRLLGVRDKKDQAPDSSAMGFLPYDPWSDLARPARPFLQLLRDLALIGVGMLMASAFFTAIGLLGYAACLYFVPEFVQH